MISESETLNTNVINELLEILGDEVREVFDEFLASAPDLITDAQNAQQTGDDEKLMTAVHSLKGAAGNIGLKKLYETSMQLETALRNQQEIDRQQLIIQIQSDFDTTVNELKTFNLVD